MTGGQYSSEYVKEGWDTDGRWRSWAPMEDFVRHTTVEWRRIFWGTGVALSVKIQIYVEHRSCSQRAVAKLLTETQHVVLSLNFLSSQTHHSIANRAFCSAALLSNFCKPIYVSVPTFSLFPVDPQPIWNVAFSPISKPQLVQVCAQLCCQFIVKLKQTWPPVPSMQQENQNQTYIMPLSSFFTLSLSINQMKNWHVVLDTAAKILRTNISLGGTSGSFMRVNMTFPYYPHDVPQLIGMWSFKNTTAKQTFFKDNFT